MKADLCKALKNKAAEVDESVPELVTRAVRSSLLEDAEDLAAFEQRRRSKCLLREGTQGSETAWTPVCPDQTLGHQRIGARPKDNRRRVARRIEALPADQRASGCEKLSVEDKYRVRQGAYRVIYLVDGGSREVLALEIGYRRNVYRWSL